VSRNVFVYRLTVELPEEASDPSWRPPDGTWDDDQEKHPREDEEGYPIPWRWPSRRLFTSKDTADRTAAKLRSWGATVTVERSNPVTWPTVGLKT
jgi:hypothetical protein